MVGYSRHIRDNEAGTLHAFQRFRSEVLSPNAKAYTGRIIKLLGDGALLEFASVVDAVRFAIATQLATRAQDIGNEAPAYRIGINIGDVVVDGDDIYGDGVNLASRLEGLAEPGGICISTSVVEQIKTKLDLKINFLGEFNVKNIPQPVPAYSIVLNEKAVAAVSDSASVPNAPARWWRDWRIIAAASILIVLGGSWWAVQDYMARPDERAVASNSDANPMADKPSIAVLPFVNRSNNGEQDYFSDGLTEDLITDLSHIAGLTVIARTSSFAYKGQSKDIRQIGKELGARYVLEGSVRRADERVRVNAQLTSVSTGQHVWAERFDQPIVNLFDLQDKFRRKIIRALQIKLSAREEQRLAHRDTTSTEAYDLYLRARKEESFFTRQYNASSRQLLEQAIKIDPTFAAAYARLAQNLSLAAENGWSDDPSKLATEALALAKKAVEIDGESPYARWSLGRIYSRAPIRDLESAIEQVSKANALDPNYADGQAFLASLMTAAGRSERALGLLEKAMRINPHFPFWYLFELGRAQYFLTRFEAAEANFKKASERNPAVFWPRRWLIATYGQLGQQNKADWEILELEALGQKFTVESAKRETAIRDADYVKLFLSGLRKAGVPER